MRRSLKHPSALALLCVVLIGASYVCYQALGTDLLPAFDEGGFVLDYVMPPGSSLQETSRVLSHVEAILRATPEVESTSRRTGLQLGLAAVTEPNTGDIAVKLKAKRRSPQERRRCHQRGSREGHDVGTGPRRRVRPGAAGHDWRPHGRTGAGCHQDGLARSRAVEHLGTAGRRRARESHHQVWQDARRRRRRRHREHDERACRPIRPSPSIRRAPRAPGFAQGRHCRRSAARSRSRWSEGEPATAPVIINDRPYTLRVRFPPSARASLEAMSSTMIVNPSGGTATLGAVSRVEELPGQTEIRREEPSAGSSK